MLKQLPIKIALWILRWADSGNRPVIHKPDYVFDPRQTKLMKQLSETRPGLYFEENGLIGSALALLWYNGRVIHVMHPAAWIAWKSGTYTATYHVCLGVSTLKLIFGPHQTITIRDCVGEKTYRIDDHTIQAGNSYERV